MFKMKGYTIKMIVKEEKRDPNIIYINASQEIFDDYELEVIDASRGLYRMVKKKKGVKK